MKKECGWKPCNSTLCAQYGPVDCADRPKKARRKKVNSIQVRAWARHLNTDPGAVIVVSARVLGGLRGDEILSEHERTILVTDLAAQLLPDLPAINDLVGGDE